MPSRKRPPDCSFNAFCAASGHPGFPVVDVGDAGGHDEVGGVGQQPAGVHAGVSADCFGDPQRAVAQGSRFAWPPRPLRCRQPIEESTRRPSLPMFIAPPILPFEVSRPPFRHRSDAFLGILGARSHCCSESSCSVAVSDFALPGLARSRRADRGHCQRCVLRDLSGQAMGFCRAGSA